MTKYSISPVEAGKNKVLRASYRGHLSAPLDGMWETFVDMAQHYQILHDGERIGYAALNDEKQILQFWVQEEGQEEGQEEDLARPAFCYLLHQLNPKGAVATTIESQFLSLCLDHHKSIEVNGLLYHATPQLSSVERLLTPAGEAELEELVEFGRIAIDDNENWLRGYYKERIAGREVYVLRSEGQIIAVGEYRPSDSQPDYADVGMAVLPSERGKGLATKILKELRQLSESLDRKAICSTEMNNPAAQKAIERAGFIAKHRIIEVRF